MPLPVLHGGAPFRLHRRVFDQPGIANHTGAMQLIRRFFHSTRMAGDTSLSHSAVWRGGAIGAGGALVMTTLVGIAAVIGMNLQGLSPEAMLDALRFSITFRALVVAGEWLTAFAGGYAAARIAGRRQIAHAFCAAGATVVLKYATWVLLGCPWAVLFAAIDLAAVIPLALIGGFLASPRATQADGVEASATESRAT